MAEPGAPWQNGRAESFHGKLRDELLNAEQFMSVMEAKVLSEQFRVEFNEVRPHSAGVSDPGGIRAAAQPRLS